MCADVVSVRAGYDEFSLVILPNKLRSQPLWLPILYQTSCDVFLFFLKLGCSTEEFCSDILAVFFHFHVFTALNVFTRMLNQWNGTERNKLSSSVLQYCYFIPPLLYISEFMFKKTFDWLINKDLFLLFLPFDTLITFGWLCLFTWLKYSQQMGGRISPELLLTAANCCCH